MTTIMTIMLKISGIKRFRCHIVPDNTMSNKILWSKEKLIQLGKKIKAFFVGTKLTKNNIDVV